MPDNNELERIYLLKSEGIDKVLADINSITSAFEASAKAKASLSNGSGNIYDSGQLKTTNELLSDMVDIQNQLLASIKGINIEYSKGSTEKVTKQTDNLSSSLDDLSNSAKNLGTNLSGIAPNLLKMQTSFNTKNVLDYDNAINKLVGDLAILNQRYAQNKANQLGDSSKVESYKKNVESQGYIVQDDGVYAGKVKIKELSDEYLKLTEAQKESALSSEEYLKIQMEITSQQNQLVEAIQTLNRSYNPSIPLEHAIAIKQDSEALLVNAKSSEDATIAAIELGVAKKALREGVNQGIYIESGQQAADIQKENEKLLEQQRILKANQELRGEAIATSINQDIAKQEQKDYLASPKGKAANKVDIQEERNEVEMLKNKSIILNESASYYQKLNAQVNTLKMSMRLLNEEELKNPAIGGIMLERTKQLDAEIKAFDKSLGNNQREVGNYGNALLNAGNLVQMFTRQLVRGIGSIIIWQLLFEAISAVSKEIVESIPGTEAYEKAQEKMTQANEKLIQSFKELSDEMVKHGEDLVTLYEVYNNGIDEAKRFESTTKAIGTINGKIGEAELNQSEAHKAVLDKEYEALERKHKVLSDIKDVLDKGQRQAEEYIGSPEVIGSSVGGDPQKNKNVQYDLYNKLASSIDKSGMPLEEQTKIVQQLNKAYEDGGDLITVYKKAVTEVGVELKKTTQEGFTNRSTKSDIDLANESKANALIYSKGVELQEQLKGVKETYRQLNENQDINSIDKIVENTTAQYKALYDKIKKQKEDFIKSIIPTSRNGKDYEKTLGFFNSLLNSYNPNGENNLFTSDTSKRDYDYDKNKLLQDESFDSSIQSSRASFDQFGAGYGGADYGRMKSALDKQTEAKKEAAKNEALQLSIQYLGDEDKLAKIEKQKQQKIIQIDKEAYSDRLKLAIDYFKRITQEADKMSAIALTQIDIETSNKITDILTGKGSEDVKNRKINKEERKGIIKSSNKIISDAEETGRNAKQTFDKSQQELDEANSSGDTDKIEMATSSVHDSEKIIKDNDKKVADARKAKAKAKNDEILENNSLLKQIADGGIKIAEQMANSYIELLSKQDAYRQEMAKRSLEWNKHVQDSEVQSKNEQLAEQKANVQAEQQLDKQKAQQDKKRAEQQLIISFVIASARAFADNPLPLAIVDEAILLAQLGIQEATLASAPTYAQGTSGHPGGWAWVGDGGESELMKVGNQVSVSPNKPTLMNLPKGTEVTPLSKIPGNLGSGLKAPSFTSNNSGGRSSGGEGSYEAHEAAINGLYGIVGQMGKHLSNMSINYDAKQAGKAGKKLNYKTSSF